MSTITFKTIRTVQTGEPGSDMSRLAVREEDLNFYGRQGFTLTASHALSTSDGHVIIDTMELTA